MDSSTQEKPIDLCGQEPEEKDDHSVFDGLDKEELQEELNQLKQEVELMGHEPPQMTHIVTMMEISGTSTFPINATPGIEGISGIECFREESKLGGSKPLAVGGGAALEESKKAEKKKDSWWVRLGRAVMKRKKSVVPKPKGKAAAESTPTGQDGGKSGKELDKSGESNPGAKNN